MRFILATFLFCECFFKPFSWKTMTNDVTRYWFVCNLQWVWTKWKTKFFNII